ncbi:MAG: pseudaminic acid synthase [Caldilineaceae bacterium]|nr:pseudaminic acid synthase [Caldilineaceae bacterium]
MSATITIGNREIGEDHSVFIIAELSANHHQDFEQAVTLIRAAADAGADAIKLQTYTPDTMTIDCRNEYFNIKGTIWEGRNLYDLYGDAYTPWDWQPKLKEIADDLGLILFSTPFDTSAVDFLEDMDVPAYKIASFEVVDLPLIRYIASKGKPIIMSTGMASLSEIEEAVDAIRAEGNQQLSLLKCTSAYPATPDEMNLRTIPDLAAQFGVPVGLSDHTLDIVVPIAAVSLGARLIEKHLTLSRNDPGPDSAFSLEPAEFKAMVDAVRVTERAMGRVHYDGADSEQKSRAFRRSLFVVQDMEAGAVFTAQNVRSIRPANGLAPKFLPDVIGRTITRSVPRGTPLLWDMVLAHTE